MVQIGFKTDQGKMRSINEDALFVMPKQNIYIVADGVGGHNAGELASRTAVMGIADYVEQNPMIAIKSEKEIKSYFYECFKTVNSSVYKLSKEEIDYKGMATTAIVLYISGKKAYLINVGDSRAYLIRSNKISQLTEDHTIVNQLLKQGSITRQEASVHPMNNMITRALGGEERIKPDFYMLDILKNDMLLLCTDGLYSDVSEEQILEIIYASANMHEACNNLVLRANDNAGKDNITTVCVKI